MDFGWHGDADIAAATAYLATRPDVDAERIGAVGMSMGGEEALGATATNQLMRAVVAEGATARAADDEAVAVGPLRGPRDVPGTARTSAGLGHRHPHGRRRRPPPSGPPSRPPAAPVTC